MEEKIIKILLGLRILMWITAFGATAYWIYYSFKLYNIGIHDVYEYASYFRPVFTKSLIVTFIAIGISYVFRTISDKVKYVQKYGKTDEDKQ